MNTRLEINKANGGDVGKKRGKKRNTLLKGFFFFYFCNIH